MINKELLFNEIKNSLALINNGTDDASFVRLAENVIDNKIQIISVLPESIPKIWAWLENNPVQIFARFDFSDFSLKNCLDEISCLSENISTAFKKGADGCQIILKYSSLLDFISQILPIINGLFFNKKLFICLDLNEIGPFDWDDVFLKINSVNAGLVLFDDEPIIGFGNQTIGKIYGLLNSIDSNCNTDIHFILGDDTGKIEQIHRLIEKLRPEIYPQIKFFIES